MLDAWDNRALEVRLLEPSGWPAGAAGAPSAVVWRGLGVGKCWQNTLYICGVGKRWGGMGCVGKQQAAGKGLKGGGLRRAGQSTTGQLMTACVRLGPLQPSAVAMGAPE